MTWVRTHLPKTAGWLAIPCLCAVAAAPARAAQPSPAAPVPAALSSSQPPSRQLAAARAAYYAALQGKSDAAEQARERFAALVREHPQDPTLRAYSGSLELLEAARTWAFWRKHTLSVEGLHTMDAAVDADPGDLEARFVRALTTWHLPFFFGRKQQAEADLQFLGPRAEQAAHTGALPPPLAAAALDYWGQVLADRGDAPRARGAYLAAVRVDGASPGGADARKRLR